jgi:DNA modification methylase
MINKVYNEPCLDTLKRIADKSIDCVITSPPYWQLRDYGYDGQWGLEPTFNEYLEHLWQLMDEIYRVLKDEGTCFINLGDSYNNSGWAGDRKDKYNDQPIVASGTKAGRGGQKGYPNKCLVLLPHRFAIGCIDRGWILRNDIIWAKRNGMPEPVTDRFTKKHEYIFFMVKSEKYYFDLDAIRQKHKHSNDKRNDGKRHEYKEDAKTHEDEMVGANAVSFNPLGKNPGSVSDFWDVTTKSSSDQHFASYNTDLIKKPILAGCPEGGVIYDPFMGTGTTAIAALRSNRNFIGSEMSTEYIKICENNIKPYLQQTKLF